ncbi:MAG: AAA family ATPase [Treponema sp.]|jgi:superfamily I DNA and/or RNA helicase|nr:AAA family ATPase [Treponema sp.]
MPYIRFDFGSQRDEQTQERAEDLENKINDMLEKYELTNLEFFNEILPHTIGFYISSPNMNREIKKRNIADVTVMLSNFLFRLDLDDYAANLLKNDTTIIIKGNLIFNSNNDQFSYVTDLYLAESTNIHPYEYYLDGVARNNSDKPQFSPFNDTNLINMDLPNNIPFMADKTKFNDFIGKWRKYLEFEKSVAIDKIESHQFAKEKMKYEPVCEVVDNAVNREEYAEGIIKEGRGNLYVDNKNPRLQGNESTYMLFSICIDANEFGDAKKEIMNRARTFTHMALSVIGEKENNQLKLLIETFKNNTKSTKDQLIPKGIDFDSWLSTEYKDKDINFYFLKEVEDSKNTNIRKEIEGLGENLYLANIATGDIALYRRGSDTLQKLEESKTRNPFLTGILSEPDKFDTVIGAFSESKVKFALKDLNQSQKDAVIKCLNSKSIFLMQGPPGTGKTQTITELVYQFNKMGKKVLLSSQTHIAIDNVFERLPKVLNILPIRLVRDRSKVNKQYLPDKVLDNLYDAAYEKYSGKIAAYNKYEKEINMLERLFQNNTALFQTIKNRLEEVKKLEKERDNHIEKLSSLRAEENEIESENRKLKRWLSVFQAYYNNGNKLSFEFVSNEHDYLLLTERLHELAKEYCIQSQDDFYNYAVAFKRLAGKACVKHLNELLTGGEKPQELKQVEKEIEALYKKEEAFKEYKKDTPTELRQEINRALQKKKGLDMKYDGAKKVDLSKEKLNFVPDSGDRDKTAIEKELDEIRKFLEHYDTILEQVLSKGEYDKLRNEEGELEANHNIIDKDIQHISVFLETIKLEINKLNAPIKDGRRKLAEYFNEFYTGKLNGAALPLTDEEKFKEIGEYIEQEKNNFAKFRDDYKKFEGIYESLKNYLEDRQQFVGAQRGKYTNDLLKKIANVYGMTCTSGQWFNPSDLVGTDDDAKNIVVEELKIRDIDFDVVIIDEVSKATPIEMLIPIVFGKSIVLVGDQRQLPPIFKYHENMFKEENEDEKTKIFQGETLDYFKKLVESSLFEEIFNKLKHNKAMLREQYRFNKAIMNCVNVFYNGELTLGAGEEQNNRKKHYLDVSIHDSKGKDTPVFCRKKSTYWFDSHSWADGTPAYSEVHEGENSYRNALEVKLTIKLLLLLEEGYEDLKRNNLQEYEMASADGKKPGVAVLSMYGKHIESIRTGLEAIGKQRKDFKSISVDISTVDNYQGKEQDIVIVNMVANTKTNNNRISEFLTKFNRINVAISRARTMLIMIGSKTYYNDVLVNVPDMDTGKENKINAYYRIYEQCESKWAAAAGIFGIKKDAKKESLGNAKSR